MSRRLTIWIIILLHLPAIGISQQIFADKTIIAGEKNNVALPISEPDDIRLLIRHSLGQTPIKPEVGGNKVVFQLPAFLDERSGTYPILVYRGEVFMGGFNLTVEPARRQDRLEVYAGPKKIMVGGRESSMIIASSLDTFGNVRPDTILYRYSIHGNAMEISRPVHRLASFHSIYTGNISGNGEVSVTTEFLHHPGITLFEAPGFPSEVQLEYSRDHEYADPGTRVEISTMPISDRFGNIVADGTLIEFILRDGLSGEISKAYGATIGGIARIILPAPDQQTIWNVTTRILGERMGSLEIPFKQSIREYEVNYDPVASRISAGPFINHQEQYLTDGVLIEMVFTRDGTSFSRSGRIMSGYYRINLSSLGLPPGEYRFEINQFGYLKALDKIEVR